MHTDLSYPSWCIVLVLYLKEFCKLFSFIPRYYFQIGEYIASNGGVVTAEEIAPYLDVETTDKTVFSYLT